MATKWISPTWRMPDEQNQSKFENYSMSFDGNSEYVDLNFQSLSTPTTISIWVNTAVNDSQQRYAIINGRADQIPVLYLRMQSNNTYQVFLSNSNGSDTLQASTATINTWFNFVIVCNNTETLLYENGTLKDSSTIGWSGIDINQSNNWQIGRDSRGQRYFKGSIDQVAIFDYALSQAQVNYLYNSGTPVNPMAISGNAPIAYYALGGSSTGSSSSLTIPNESVPSATVFNFASGDQINITNPTFLDNITEFTISFWYNKGNLNNPTGTIISRGATPNGFGLSQFRNQGGDANSFYFRVDSSSGTKGFYTFANPTNVGEWAHVCLVWNSTNQIIYVNGIDIKNEASLGGTLNGSGNNLIIGNPGTSLLYDLSNFQIWNTTLLDTEIATLYNNGVPLLSGTQPQAANLKAWYSINVDNATWNGNNWIIEDSSIPYNGTVNFKI